MTVQSMNNMRFGHITGFNSYRGANSAGLGSGSMLYNNSIYGYNPRVGNGSRFYNPGAMGTYVQFDNSQTTSGTSSWWKGALKIAGGIIGGFVVSWLLSDNNSEKAGNWISNLFSSNKSGGTETSKKTVDESILNNNKTIMGSEMDDN